MHEILRACESLIVDDSASVRQILTRELGRDPVLRSSGPPAIRISRRDKRSSPKHPDVLTLDVDDAAHGWGYVSEKADVSTILMPVVVLSSLAANGTRIALDALEHGAVDVFLKPSCVRPERARWPSMQRLIETIKAAGDGRA